MASAKNCEPCKVGGRSIKATVWCNECEEPLCKNCESSHKRMKKLRNHHTIDIKLITVDGAAAVLDNYCTDHSKMEIDSFCTSHDELCCRLCMIGKHRSCSKILSLEEASTNAKKSESFKSISKSMNTVSDTAGLILDHLKKNQEFVEDKALKLKKEVSTAKQKIIDQLNNTEKDINGQIVKIKSDVASDMKQGISDIRALKTKISQKSVDAKFIEKHGSNEQAFVFSRKNGSEMNDIEQSMMDMTPVKEYDILFDDKSDEVVRSVKQFGRISLERKNEVVYTQHNHHQAQAAVESTKTITRLEQDLEFGVNANISGIVVTECSHLLICESINNSIKKTNFDGKVIGSITLASITMGITLIPNTETAVISLHLINSLKFISVRDMNVMKTIQLPGSGKGMSSSSEKIVVGGLKALYILDTTGKLIQTMKVTNKQSFPIQSTHVCTDGSIVYTDATAVYKVNSKGQELWKYTSKDLTAPQGITEDADHCIYVVYMSSNIVASLTSDGQFRETMINSENGLNHPFALCFSQDFKYLFTSIVAGGILRFKSVRS